MNSPAQPPAPLPRKKLPTGIQTFREIIEDNCYYVDKTGLALDMIEQGKAYFLSRPQKWGRYPFMCVYLYTPYTCQRCY